MRPAFDESESWENETVQKPIKLKDFGSHCLKKAPLPPAPSTGFSDDDLDEAQTVEWRRPQLPLAQLPLAKTRSVPAIAVAKATPSTFVPTMEQRDLPAPVSIGPAIRIRPIWIVTLFCLVIAVAKGVPAALSRVDVVNGKLSVTAPK